MSDSSYSRLVGRLLSVGRLLPAGWAWRLGLVLGWAFANLPLRDPRRARAHLAQAFPDATPAWCAATACRVFAHVGGAALWTLATLCRPAAAAAWPRRIDGLRHWAASLAAARRGQGTVLATAHLGHWELHGRLTGSHSPLSVVGRTLRSPLAQALTAHLRQASRVVPQDAGVMALARELRQGRLLATLADQDIPRLAGGFVPWFGQPAWTPIGPAAVAALARAAIQPVACLRQGWQPGWRVIWGPRRSIESFTGDREERVLRATAWAMAWIEDLVRRHPDQWVWWHKRWRTRPADRPDALLLDAQGHVRRAGQVQVKASTAVTKA